MIDNNKAPIIQPIKLKEYETKQSKYETVPQIPFRSVILGPSGSGKTMLLQNMILEIYRNSFSRVYIFVLPLMWMPLGLQSTSILRRR